MIARNKRELGALPLKSGMLYTPVILSTVDVLFVPSIVNLSQHWFQHHLIVARGSGLTK
jgi:hypothetical protein